HDRLRIVLAPARQFRRAFSYLMQVHENHYTKRAGVAGIRARATLDSVILIREILKRSITIPSQKRGI
ncbi:hypothetical protein Q5681_26890, partial [Klebsiella pneumoniae]|uniref:hypothetical protein n=1 Tax=Klebsiella pneumoniae TaxID=573 RepID=UPI001B8CC7AC